MCSDCRSLPQFSDTHNSRACSPYGDNRINPASPADPFSEFWSDAASPNVKVTDIESLSRSLHSLMSLFVEPAIRQLYLEKVAKAGLDISDEDTLYVHRNDFGGLYLRMGALCVSMAEDEDIVQKVCDLLSDNFTRIVKSLNDN